jgi:hypothetical protein
MKNKHIDALNIGLMLISVVLALILPFKLFLFSYAVLGPLHYLTEIGWLRKRNFFTHGKGAPWILTAFALLTTLGFLAVGTKYLTGNIYVFLARHLPHLILLAFVCALITLLVKNWKLQVFYSLIATIAVLSLQGLPHWLIFICALLPTMLHVYVFTGAFIMVGSIRSKSKLGWVSLLVFIAVPFLLLFIPDQYIASGLTDKIGGVIQQSGFATLNRDLSSFFGIGENFELASPAARRVQALIAFAYTYHYLNWFSKTGIIKWHEVSKGSLIISGVIWVGSVGLYIWDFQTGLLALFFLSLMHVYLEFPLNHRSFGEIGNAVVRIFK